MRSLRLAPLILVLWLVAPATAAVTSTPVFLQTPKGPLLQLSNASGTTSTTFITAGSNGTKVFGISCSNTDTNPYTIQFNKVRSGTSYLQATLTLPASAGSSTSVAAFSALTVANFPGLPADSDGSTFMYLESGDTVNLNVTSTITAGKFVSCMATSADF